MANPKARPFSPMHNRDYRQLERIFAEHYYLKRTLSLLHWDTAVMMPAAATPIRAKQIAAQTATVKQKISGPKVAKLLERAEKDITDLTAWQQANFREMRRLHTLHTAIPDDLLINFNERIVIIEQAWRQAKQNNDYLLFSNSFASLLPLLREKAEALAKVFQTGLYEGLMQEYDPGGTQSGLEGIFVPLETALPALIKQIQAQQANKFVTAQPFTLTPRRQRALCRQILKALGFDFRFGRLDQSAHPFTEGGVNDIRMTTRYDKSRPLLSLLSAIHECGHALYDVHLPPDWHAQPVGSDLGMTVHEGVALFYEMGIARSRGFADYLAAICRQRGWPCDEQSIYQALLRIAPGPIRIDADEVSYLPHIILRYRLENLLLQDKIALPDIPEYWSAQMQSLLGVTPLDHREGCLQDVHWSLGLFGYFPCYGKGALLASWLADRLPYGRPSMAFDTILNWLVRHIFSNGCRFSQPRLMRRIGAAHLSADDYIGYLKSKFLTV